MQEHEDYRDVLKNVYSDRNSVNESYSIRAFAKDLEIAPSTLSEILAGKKNLSSSKAKSVAVKLRLPMWYQQYFSDLVTIQTRSNKLIKEQAAKRLESFDNNNKLKMMNYMTKKAITSWVDLAILEMSYLRGFHACPQYISKKLKVDEEVVKTSLDRLIEIKMLVKDDAGKWADSEPFLSSSDGVTSDSIRVLHLNLLKLFQKKLEEEKNIKNRIMKSAILSVSSEKKKLIEKVMDEAISKIANIANDSSQDRDEVWCFSTQFMKICEKG